MPSLAVPGGSHGRGANSPILSAILVLSLLVALPGHANAQSIDSRFWGTDGSVSSIVSDGGTIYIGGFFRRVGPVTGSGAAINAGSGAVQKPFAGVWGVVRAAVA